jgi:hypothetical protein
MLVSYWEVTKLSNEDYEIDIYVKRSTAELLKKFRLDHGFADNDEVLIALIKNYEAKQ